jgi:hypothetical protein
LILPAGGPFEVSLEEMVPAHDTTPRAAQSAPEAQARLEARVRTFEERADHGAHAGEAAMDVGWPRAALAMTDGPSGTTEGASG